MDATDKYFPAIESYILPATLPEMTVQVLRAEGNLRVESLVFWAGYVNGSTAVVTQIFIPKGDGVFQHRLQHRIDERIIAAIGELLDPPQLVLLGQVHTHEHDAFHSPADDKFSLDTPGFLSVVIPDFASGESSAWQHWAFYECVASGTFRELPSDEIRKKFTLNGNGPCELTYVEQ